MTVGIYWLSGLDEEWEPDFSGADSEVRNYLSTQDPKSLQNYIVKFLDGSDRVMTVEQFLATE